MEEMKKPCTLAEGFDSMTILWAKERYFPATVKEFEDGGKNLKPWSEKRKFCLWNKYERTAFHFRQQICIDVPGSGDCTRAVDPIQLKLHRWSENFLLQKEDFHTPNYTQTATIPKIRKYCIINSRNRQLSVIISWKGHESVTGPSKDRVYGSHPWRSFVLGALCPGINTDYDVYQAPILRRWVTDRNELQFSFPSPSLDPWH